jgi:hypothetical protein
MILMMFELAARLGIGGMEPAERLGDFFRAPWLELAAEGDRLGRCPRSVPARRLLGWRFRRGAALRADSMTGLSIGRVVGSFD